jgi:hypothetical protein
MHRAKIAQQRVWMEGWRQRRLGSKRTNLQQGRKRKTDLTLTGLLMEGVEQCGSTNTVKNRTSVTVKKAYCSADAVAPWGSQSLRHDQLLNTVRLAAIHLTSPSRLVI